MLKWRGKLYGRPMEGFVQAGAIFGPLEVTSLVEAYVSGGIRVSWGPWTGAADLTDPRGARAVIAAVLDDDSPVEFEGMPEPAEPPLPAGVTP